jgi:hypothetical protein
MVPIQQHCSARKFTPAPHRNDAKASEFSGISFQFSVKKEAFEFV